MKLTEAREHSAKFIRALDDNARRLWEMPGPKDTVIHALEAWTVRAEGDRLRVVIVQIMGSRHDQESDGWMIFPEVGLIQIDQTRAAYLRLPMTEQR